MSHIYKKAHFKELTLLLLFVSLQMIANLEASWNLNSFTGNFLSDSRPHRLMYLFLTQIKDSISGSLIIVTSNGHGSTKSTNLPLRGTRDGDVITLVSSKLLGNILINGRKQKDKVRLMFTTDSGNISDFTFSPANEDHYNLLLKQWQNELSDVHKQKQVEITTIHNEKDKLKKLAETLSEDINSAKSSWIKRNLEDLKFALYSEQSALHNLENDFDKLKYNASLRPMSCYQANSLIDYDYNSTMTFSYNSTLGYAHDMFMNKLTELEERLSNVEFLASSIRQKSSTLDQAIKESRYSQPKLKVMPSEGRQVLEQYQELAASIRNELSSLKVTHSDILRKAEEIMSQGKIILNKTLGSVRCN